MRKTKYWCAALTLLLVAVLLVSSMGVAATWNYSLSAPETIDLNLNISLFEWKGSSALPNDVAGENHRALIKTILEGTVTDENGNTVEIGLNNPDSYISSEIASRSGGSWWATSDTLGSMDYWEREDINNYFNLDTTKLTFVLYFPDGVSDTYYLFTTSIELGGSNSPNIPIGEKVYPVYRTVLQLNEIGEWEATETKTGYALSAYYDNRITGSTFVKYPSFDPASWTEQTLGTSTENAIYTYLGQTTTAYMTQANGQLYYAYTASSSASVVVSSQTQNASLRVYAGNLSTPVSATSGAQGSGSLTFYATRNTTYYIEVGGATSVMFSLTRA